MKLSQAIRNGAKLRPQARLAFFYAGKSCALGAAYEGYYGSTNTSMEEVADCLSRRFPVLRLLLNKSQVPSCIEGDGKDQYLLNNVVTTLNDYKGWTREQVADWVETFEE